MPISRQNERNLGESVAVEGDQSKGDAPRMIADEENADKVGYVWLEMLLAFPLWLPILPRNQTTLRAYFNALSRALRD